MPFGSWGNTARNQTGGLSGAKPATNPWAPASQVNSGGGNVGYYGAGQGSVEKRQFADVGKVNANLIDPSSLAREGSDYMPVDHTGPLGGLANYYDPRTPGGLFAGALGAIGQTVGGVFGAGAQKTGSDVGTFVGKSIEAPMAAVGSIGVPFVAPVIDDANAQIEKSTPYILKDTLKIPTNIGGAFQSLLNVFGLMGRAVERTYAGTSFRNAMGQLPKDIQAKLDSGELTSEDQALDELVLTGRGFTNDQMHNMILSIATDPANWISGGVGVIGGAARGTGVVARTFSGLARAGELGGGVLRDMPELQNLASAAVRGEAITPLIRNRATMNQIRQVLDDTGSPARLKLVERMGMSALGPVNPETSGAILKMGQYALRATDPVNFFWSGRSAGKRSMEDLAIATSTGIMAAYKPTVVNRVLRLADDIGSGGSTAVNDALGIHTANLMQEVGIAEMTSDAMRSGAVPKVDSLSATEAVRGTLRGSGFDANIGKYAEVMVEQHKDMAVLRLAQNDMDAVTHAKLATLLNTDAGTVAARMGKVSGDEAMLVHALYYYAKGKTLHTTVTKALEQAQAAGTLASDIAPDRVAIISPRTLTKQRVHLIHDAIATGDPEEIRRVASEFEDFDWLNRKNVENPDLVRVMTDYMASNEAQLYDEIPLIDPATGTWRAGLPKELTDWASDAEVQNYRLGQRMPRDVPLEAQWRVVRSADGTEIINAKPYLDFWSEGQEVRKLGRFNALRMEMTRSVRQERIIWQQRRSFITDLAKHSDDPAWVTVPPDISARLWQALMFRAEDLRIQPRGMAPGEMMETAQRVLKEASQHNASHKYVATKLTERQVTLALLRATQGDIKTVGASQWITGGIKAKTPGVSAANTWGQISERLYPLMRFTLNPVFQVMEFTEPYILNAMRGIYTPLNREGKGFRAALATHNAVQQLAKNSFAPDGMLAETAEALSVRAYETSAARVMAGPRSFMGRHMFKIAQRKDAAAALETKRIFGDTLHAAFKDIKGDQFEAFWSDMEHDAGSVNRGDVAMHWMSANFALQDMNGQQVGLFTDLMNAKNLGARIRVTKTSDKNSYTFADVEELIDLVRSNNGNLPEPRRAAGKKPGQQLLDDLAAMTRDEWDQEVSDIGLSAKDARVGTITKKNSDDIWRLVHGPQPKEFWKGYRTTFLRGVRGPTSAATRKSRDQEVNMARALVKVWATSKNMTEQEFIALHFDDVPTGLAHVAQAMPFTPGTLTDIRHDWAAQAMKRDIGPPVVRVRDSFLARKRGEVHPMDAVLFEDQKNHIYVPLSDRAHQKLIERLAMDEPGFGDYTLGYTSPRGLAYDSAPDTRILRFKKTSGLTLLKARLGNAHQTSEFPDVLRHNAEILTEDGWQPFADRVPGRITPKAGPDPWSKDELDYLFTGLGQPHESAVWKTDFDAMLSEGEKMAGKRYEGPLYANLNTWLRGVPLREGAASMSEEDLIRFRDNMDAAIQKGFLRESKTLWRGINISRTTDEFHNKMTIDFESMNVGDEFADPAFVSTSDNYTEAYDFSQGGGHVYVPGEGHKAVVMVMDLPAGFHMNLIEGEEGEHVLGRNVRFRITKKTVGPGRHGTLTTLHMVPTDTETLPGVKRLALGEAGERVRNGGIMRYEAMATPDVLRARVPDLPENVREAIGDQVEYAIAAAEISKPREVGATIGGRKFGRLTTDEVLGGIVEHLDDDQIKAASETYSDIRTRVEGLLSTSNLVDEWGDDLDISEVVDSNDTRFLAAMVPAIRGAGSFREGLQLLLGRMERIWDEGPQSGIRPQWKREYGDMDDVAANIASHLLRGVKYAMPTPYMDTATQDALDVLLGNTTRRAVGRTNLVQPVWSDDVLAEAVGFITPGALEDLKSQGHNTAGLVAQDLNDYGHEYIVDFFNKAKDTANEEGLGGRRNWTAGELAAVAARAREAQGRSLGVAPAIDELDRATKLIPVELYPGPGSELDQFAPLFDLFNQKRYRAERHAMLTSAGTAIGQYLRDRYGIVIDSIDDVGVGVWREGKQPMVPIHTFSSDQRVDDVADILSYGMGQAEVWAWKNGPDIVDIERAGNWDAYDPRVTISVGRGLDMGKKKMEKVAVKLGQKLPFARGLSAVSQPDGSWTLHIIDREHTLPRVESGEVNYDLLDRQLGEALDELDPEQAIETKLDVEYGQTYVAGPDRLPDGSLDWDGHREATLARLSARGQAARPEDLDGLRSVYRDDIKDTFRDYTPQNYGRTLRGEPISRDLEDARGGDTLGLTSPRGTASAVIRGFGNADALTGVHELVHVFSLSGLDPSLREAVSKSWDEYATHVQGQIALRQAKLAKTTNRSYQTRLRNQITALEGGLQNPHPGPWGKQQEEHLVQLVWDWMDRGVPDNPELANVFSHFRNWIERTRKELGAPGMPPVRVSPAMEVKLNRMLSRPSTPSVSYSIEHQSMRMAAQQTLKSAYNEAHATQFYKKDRSMLERSINHPYIGLYPASYMWGKVLPEMLRFLALRPFGQETPFLAWNVFREISDSIRSQTETDDNFKKFMEQNKEAWQLISMLFPALPQDIPANASLPLRRVAEQGLEAQAKFAKGIPAGGERGQVHPIDYTKGAMDAVSYALGPLGTIRTVNDVAGHVGNLAGSAVQLAQGVDIAPSGGDQQELLPFR